MQIRPNVVHKSSYVTGKLVLQGARRTPRPAHSVVGVLVFVCCGTDVKGACPVRTEQLKLPRVIPAFNPTFTHQRLDGMVARRRMGFVQLLHRPGGHGPEPQHSVMSQVHKAAFSRKLRSWFEKLVVNSRHRSAARPLTGKDT